MTEFSPESDAADGSPQIASVPLLLLCDGTIVTPAERGGFLLGFEHGVAMATVAGNPGGRVRWPVHAANRARVIAGCTALGRRVTFERVFAPMRTAGVHGRTIGVGTGMLIADVRPAGWRGPNDDGIVESAADGE